MPYADVAALALFAGALTAASGGFVHSPINGPLAFLPFGMALGPSVLGVIDIRIRVETIAFIAEGALAVVLFTDAATANLPVLRRSFQLPERLLLLALPLTILSGFPLAIMILDLSVLEAGLMAAILAPTDAALGQPVITNQRVPPNLRAGLSVESGLNDGLCVPLFLAFMAFAVGEADGSFTETTLQLISLEVGLGALAGAALAAAAVGFIALCERENWLVKESVIIPAAATGIAVYASAQLVGGSGLIAAFVGGLVFGVLCGDRCRPLLDGARAAGDLLAVLTWIFFGAIVLNELSVIITPAIVLYSVLSLTVVRMVSVLLALSGTGMCLEDKLFVGWFGPRGLASIVFAGLVLTRDLPGGETIVATAFLTVVLSAILHCITALPAIAALPQRMKQ